MASIVNHVLAVQGFFAYAIVALFCFGEASFMLGFVIPGETAVILGGVLASRHHVSLPVMLAVVIGAAIAGDSVGFEVGKKLGPKLLALKPLRKRSGVTDKALGFIRRRGMAAVFIGRWTAFLRAVTPGLAGMSEMHYPRFLLANATGGIVWGTTFTLLGYFIGEAVERTASWASWVILGAVAVVLATLSIRSRLREHRMADSREQAGVVADGSKGVGGSG